ncbi:MAG: primosomal protein N' [Planctomycetia bacterium]|nr:primosomal protein N' [Planctomycetia bacterium]
MPDQLRLFNASLPDENPWEVDSREEHPAATVVFSEGVEQPLDYAIPEGLLGKVQKGCRLLVPLGKSNRLCEVFCVDIHTFRQSQWKLKYIAKVLDAQPLVSSRMLEWTRWIADYYLCPWGTVLQTVVPVGVRSQAGTRETIFYQLSPEGTALWQEYLQHGSVTTSFRLTEPQLKILLTLHKAGKPLTTEELTRQAKVSAGPIRLLKSRGLLQVEKERIFTRPTEVVSVQPQGDLSLNADQQRALEQIRHLLQAKSGETLQEREFPGLGKVRSALIHGITGSGKTEVYIQAIREVVRMGRQAIVLVPEISLTPQTVERFRKRFRNIAVWHSHLTDAQRYEEWCRISRGDVEVVIGARSAIFAPTPRLGLIIMDEEHETSFKQETAPRYHAREIALGRGALEKVVVLLGSATPSLESWYAVEKGESTLISLPQRVENRPLPHVETVDMRVPDRTPTRGVIGRKLHIAMRECLAEGHQMILLLNRRGYSTYIQCPACGTVLSCPHCEISLTHHRTTHELICHYCDYHQPQPETCPHCGSRAIRYSGTGTQKLEQEIAARFPKARVFRMDTDSMQGRDAHEKAFSRFRAGEIDILLGTQMIAKGLDFPNVTLVGVIQADTALHLPDFRAEERTFHLITQVAGRTGRGKWGGEVLVQTFQPENPAIEFACQHDFCGFAQYALPLRQALQYPPYGSMARIIARGREEKKTLQTAEMLAAEIRKEGGDLLRVLGPAPCPVTKLKDFFRFHIQVQAPVRETLANVLRQVQKQVKTPEEVPWIVDMDPLSML